MRVLYAKYNRERKKEFQIETVIYEENEKKYVRKKALTQQAESHIVRIEENCKIINDNGSYRALQGNRNGNTIVFPYISGATMSEELVGLLKMNDINSFIDVLEKYVISLNEMNGKHIESYSFQEHLPFCKGGGN
ncbi:hypothetical protein [Paenibacillus ihbetae]|uniref:Uncharacterized protein n=1 Tax=Paenibacillus ihbetae TaxID=1870820 RepID=A0ABX3K2M2_9BACL|nr:hypothetical protein [Paenibacillus ihbetae]OOC63689.1 hypothetical protein BBD40_18635 [Paenibacillus ihbetae]